MAGDEGKQRETRRSPSRQRRDRSQPSESSSDEDMDRGRSRSRGRDRGRRRTRPPSWVFARQVSAVTHSDRCPKCSAWISHKVTSYQDRTYDDAMRAEEAYWLGWARECDHEAHRAPSLDRRSRSAPPPRKRARQESPSRPTPGPPTEPAFGQAAPSAPSQPSGQAPSVPDPRDARIEYLENVAELFRRQLSDRGYVYPNLWSSRAANAPLAELETSYREAAYREQTRSMTQLELELLEMSSDEEDSEQAKRRRRRANQAKGTWKSRTVESSSRSMNDEERAAAKKPRKTAPPLEERFETFAPQPGPFHRDQGGGSSTSQADRWHSNEQGHSSRPLSGRLTNPPSAPSTAPTSAMAPNPSPTAALPARPVNLSRPPRDVSGPLTFPYKASSGSGRNWGSGRP